MRAKTTLQALGMEPEDAYFHSVSIISDALRNRMLSPELRQGLDGYRTVELFREYAARVPDRHSLELIQYLDIKTYLPGDILTKVDRASMAHSLEVRVPILDHHLVEWAACLPSRLKLNGGQGKFILKKSFETRVPDDILYRPKMGFSVPLATWFRGPLRERLRESLLGAPLVDSGFIDRRFVHRMIERHESGVSDYSTPLWALMMFGSFLATAA